jgi:hypothetical protein
MPRFHCGKDQSQNPRRASHHEQHSQRQRRHPSPEPKPQTSKEVIAANVKLLIEQLEAGHSEALTAYLTQLLMLSTT